MIQHCFLKLTTPSGAHHLFSVSWTRLSIIHSAGYHYTIPSNTSTLPFAMAGMTPGDAVGRCGPRQFCCSVIQTRLFRASVVRWAWPVVLLTPSAYLLPFFFLPWFFRSPGETTTLPIRF